MKPRETKGSSFHERFEALRLALRWTYESSKFFTILIFFVVIFGGLLTLVEPFIFKIIIDKIVSGTESSLVSKLGLGLVGILVVYGVARVIQSILWDIQNILKKMHSQKLDKHVATLLMDKISSLDMAYFEDPEYYATLTKANQNLWRVNELFWQFTWFLGQAISVAVIIIALFSFNWVVVLIILSASIPSIIFAFKASKIVWSAFDSASPISREAHYYRGLLIESPQAIKEVKLFGLKPHFVSRFSSLFDRFIGTQQTAAKKEFGLYVFVGIVEGALSIVAAWLVVKAFLENQISIGELTFYWTLLFRFAEHARYMVRMIGELNQNATFITPFVRILAFRSTIREIAHPRLFPTTLQKGIEFRNVTFSYPRAKKPALKHFSLLKKPGESIALVGENGSGKTTLVKLLTRLYDVSEGDILIDGVSIKEYSVSSLHEHIGVIFQDFMKYESLVEENIGYGCVTQLRHTSKIHEASLKAEAYDFIKDLERKYKTHVGKTLKDEGVELSVGQWQKIALARAFFKDAPILCLDEPTAAVDAKAEYQLFQKFEKLTKGKTTILISHRFSTVRMADRIVLIEDGKIAEQGSHHELLRKRGKYEKLFRMQAEGYRDYFHRQSV